MTGPTADQAWWYVAYGSNLATTRLGCYLAGGRPAGGSRDYAGCRDRRPPAAARPVALRGALVFGGRSTVWGGGMAFLDTAGPGYVAGRAFALAPTQVNDLVAQEVRLPPGTDMGLEGLGPGSRNPLPSPAYDSLVRLPDLDGRPAVTITAGRPPAASPPSAGYLRWICTGLVEANRWSAEQVARYLLRARGVRGAWTVASLTALAASVPPVGSEP